MKTIRAATLVVATLIGFTRQPAAAVETGCGFHFPVGFAYSRGIQDANNKLFDFYKADGYDVTKVNIPVGLVLNPYYDWATAAGAVGVGVSVGPTAMVLVDEKLSGGGDNYKFSYAVPVGAFTRYTPWPTATVSPYVRAGYKYPFAGGSNFEPGQGGFFGAVGLDFWRTKAVGLSLEVGCDTSKLRVKYSGASKDVNCPGLTVALSVVF